MYTLEYDTEGRLQIIRNTNIEIFYSRSTFSQLLRLKFEICSELLRGAQSTCIDDVNTEVITLRSIHTKVDTVEVDEKDGVNNKTKERCLLSSAESIMQCLLVVSCKDFLIKTQ